MSNAWIFLAGLNGRDSMADIDTNPSSMGLIFEDVDRTEPWGSEMDHPPLGRSYLVVVSSYDISCALILFVKIPWMISISNLFDRSNSWGVDRTYPRGPEFDDLPLGWSYLVVVLSFMSCALIFLTGLYG